MTKMPPLVSPYYQPKKIQRLIFPKNGDSNIFSKCGRKHFIQKLNRPTPYAIIPAQLSSSPPDYVRPNEENLSFSALQYREHFKPKNYSPKGEYRYQDEYKGQYHPQSHTRQALDQQVYSFTINKVSKPSKHSLTDNNYHSYEQSRPERTIQDRHRYSNIAQSRPLRIQTQIQTSIPPQPQLKPITRKRSRTQATEPGVVKSYFREPRFNPTFLSSLNY